MNQLESELRAGLHGAVEQAGASSRSVDEALRTARAGVGRQRRSRRIALVAASLSVSVLGAGVGVRALSDKSDARQEVALAADDFDPDFRLMPGWLPDGVLSAMYIDNSSFHPAKGSVIIWRSGERQVFLMSRVVQVDAPEGTLADGLTAALKTGFVRWKIQLRAGAHVELMADGLPPTEMRPLLSRVGVNEDGTIAPLAPPPGFAEWFNGPVSAIEPAHTWQISFAGQGDLFAMRFESLAAELNRDFQSGKDVIVRKQLGKWRPASGSGLGQLSWHDRGWTFAVNAVDESAALRIAEGLVAVSSDQWDALVRSSASGVRLAETGSERLELFEQGGRSISAEVGRISEVDGCVVVQFMIDSRTLDACVPLAGEALLWSRRVETDGGQVALAAVRFDVDAVVAPGTRAGGATRSISSEALPAAEVETNVPVVAVVKSGDKYESIGLVAIEIPSDSPSVLDLYRVVTPEPDDPSDGLSATEPDPQSRLEPIARIEVAEPPR